jgi:6-pyruvoyltetrahydropterin/6-carboxytetrahydropterin synthase
MLHLVSDARMPTVTVSCLENPTSENVARWVWRQLQRSLPSLSKIVVRETCTSVCIYTGESEA